VLTELRELWRFRELLWILVLRDLKVRYKNSALGFAWSLINPVIQVAVISVVVRQVMRVDVPNLSAYIFCAVLPWSFFQLALLDTSHSLIVNERLMKKVYFPREIIPLSLIVSNLIHLLLAICVFLVYLVAWVQAPLLPSLAWIPLVIVVETLLIVGIALVVAGVSVFYEDVKHLMVALLQVLYFAVPVIYFTEQVEQSKLFRENLLLLNLYMLNPLVTIITAFRASMLQPTYLPDWNVKTAGGVEPGYLLFTVLFSLLVAILGYSLFNRMKWSFVERP
jgi:lipopolysaccharide transport system permease protein